MGWSVGYDTNWCRDIGYGVPAQCDYPGCYEQIHRGLAYVCGGEPYGGDHGCGLYFCDQHLYYVDEDKPQRCDRCVDGEDPFTATADVAEWLNWKLTDPSWATWRSENPGETKSLAQQLSVSREHPAT